MPYPTDGSASISVDPNVFGQASISVATLRRYQREHRRAWRSLLAFMDVLAQPDAELIVRRTLRKQRRAYLRAELAQLLPFQTDEREQILNALRALDREENPPKPPRSKKQKHPCIEPDCTNSTWETRCHRCAVRINSAIARAAAAAKRSTNLCINS